MDWIQFLLPPSFYLLFSSLPPPSSIILLPDARTTDPASVSATATTIGFGRRKEERRRDKEKKGREEIGLREEEGHCFGDVSEVILVDHCEVSTGCRLVLRGGDLGDSLTHAEVAPAVTSLFVQSSLLDFC